MFTTYLKLDTWLQIRFVSTCWTTTLLIVNWYLHLKMHERSWVGENNNGGSARESASVSERVTAATVLLMTPKLPAASKISIQSIVTRRCSAPWMNPVSVGEYHGLRVGSALLSIVAGCIIIGVSRECDADAVGGIFLGAGGLGKYKWKMTLTTQIYSCLPIEYCTTNMYVFQKLLKYEIISRYKYNK